MDNSARRDESAVSLKLLSDDIIGILDVNSLEVSNNISKFPVKIDRHRSLSLFNQAALDARLIIILTKTWSAVHDASTCVRSDEVRTDHSEALLCFHVFKVIEERYVSFADEVFAWNLFQDLVLFDVSLFKDLFKSGLSQDVNLLLILINNFQVGEVGVESQSEVAG